MYSDPRKQSQIMPDHQNHVYNVYIDAQAHDLCHTNVMGADKAKIPGSWIEVFIISERILSEHDTNKPKMGPFRLMYQLHLLRCQTRSPRELISGGCGCWASRSISGGLAPISIFRTTFFVQFWSPLGNLDWHHPLIASK